MKIKEIMTVVTSSFLMESNMKSLLEFIEQIPCLKTTSTPTNLVELTISYSTPEDIVVSLIHVITQVQASIKKHGHLYQLKVKELGFEELIIYSEDPELILEETLRQVHHLGKNKSK